MAPQQVETATEVPQDDWRNQNLSLTDLKERCVAREKANALKQAELDQLMQQLHEAEQQLAHSASIIPILETDAKDAEVERAEKTAEATTLKSTLADLKVRREETDHLLDAREAEMRETEEAVQMFENRETARAREVRVIEQRLQDTEEALRHKQRELARLEHTRDGQAAAIWWDRFSGTGGSSATSGPSGRSASTRQVEIPSDEDEDVAALALREPGSKARGDLRHDETEFMQFHSLALSIKLSLASSSSGGPRRTGSSLRNVSVADLWEDARRERLPRTEWRAFLNQRLFGPPVGSRR